ncbi:hypothetical protein ES705_16848 [subsurface metagenome]
MIDMKLLMRQVDEKACKCEEILTRAIDNDGYRGDEKREYQKMKKEIDDLEEQIREARELENIKMGMPRNYQVDVKSLMNQRGDPGPGMVTPGVSENRGFAQHSYSTGHRNFGEFVQDIRFPAEFQVKRGFDMITGASGGFLVPDQFLGEIMFVTPESSIVRSRATVLPLETLRPDNKIGIPALDQKTGMLGGIKMSWIGEGKKKPEMDFDLALVTLEPIEVGGHVVITDKLLRNDAGAASMFFEKVFREAIFDEEDFQFLCGTGVGGPKGILNSACRIEVARDTTSDFKFADIASMVSKFYVTNWSNGLWVINLSVLPKLVTMEDTAGHLIYTGGNIEKRLPPSILGIPVRFTGRTPTLGNTGDVMLCNFEYYLIKNGSGPFVMASEHVYFTENKTVVKIFYNVDGSSWLNNPLTLRDGTTQVSPFVVLEA